MTLRSTAARVAAAIAVISFPLLGGCAGPLRTYDDFASKAAYTAETMTSAVQTARLDAITTAEGDSFAPYTEVSLGHAMSAAVSVVSGFASVQPAEVQPADGLRVHELRDALAEVLDDAVATIADARQAAARGRTDRLRDIAARLDDIARKLASFRELA